MNDLQSVELYAPEDSCVIPPRATEVFITQVERDGKIITRITYRSDVPAATIRGDGERLDRTEPLPLKG